MTTKERLFKVLKKLEGLTAYDEEISSLWVENHTKELSDAIYEEFGVSISEETLFEYRNSDIDKLSEKIDFQKYIDQIDPEDYSTPKEDTKIDWGLCVVAGIGIAGWWLGTFSIGLFAAFFSLCLYEVISSTVADKKIWNAIISIILLLAMSYFAYAHDFAWCITLFYVCSLVGYLFIYTRFKERKIFLGILQILLLTIFIYFSVTHELAWWTSVLYLVITTLLLSDKQDIAELLNNL